MIARAHIGAVFAAIALCAPLVGCGDDDVGDPIPQDKRAELESQLARARANFDQDRCDEAMTAVNEARTIADTLDDNDVGSDVQDAVADGIDNLGSLVTADCEEEEVETTPETVPETVPPPTETAPPPTETVPPPPTETAPVPEPEPEPDEDDGGAQFDPNIPPGQQRRLEEGD